MTRWAIVDTGPLVASLDRGERYHAWAVDQIRQLDPPLLICEPVLAETLFLLTRLPIAQDAVLGLLEKGVLKIGFHISDHASAVRKLCKQYRNVPMSLADACLVRMAEMYDRHSIFTLDSDFTIYRKYERKPLTLIIPGRT